MLTDVPSSLMASAAKATDEKQTEINWEIALTVWDKVNEDGETGCAVRDCEHDLIEPALTT